MTRALEVCAGIGGFSLAAEWMGWEVAGHVEIDPFCTRVLKHHWPEVPHVSDIYEVRGDEFGAIDLLCGGIPCQPFSVAGKQAGERDPRHLWPEFRRLVQVIRPRWVVVENVSGFVRLALDTCWSDLESAGYTCGAVVLPACGVNAPHRRDRIWLVAHAAASRPPSGRSGSGGTVRDEGRRPEPERRSGALADAQARGLRRGESSGIAGQPARGGEDVSDAYSNGRARIGHAEPNAIGSAAATDEGCGNPVLGVNRRHETQPGLGLPDDGLSRRMARHPERTTSEGEGVSGSAYLDPRWGRNPLAAFGPEWEDGVPRVTSGCEQRVNKLKALGNALVPQIAYQVFRTIAEADNA